VAVLEIDSFSLVMFLEGTPGPPDAPFNPFQVMRLPLLVHDSQDDTGFVSPPEQVGVTLSPPRFAAHDYSGSSSPSEAMFVVADSLLDFLSANDHEVGVHAWNMRGVLSDVDGPQILGGLFNLEQANLMFGADPSGNPNAVRIDFRFAVPFSESASARLWIDNDRGGIGFNFDVTRQDSPSRRDVRSQGREMGSLLGLILSRIRESADSERRD